MKNRKFLCVILTFALLVSSLVYISSNSEAADSVKLSAPTYDAEKDYAVWDCIYFGWYPQETIDEEDVSPVKWRVLSIDENNKALIISDKCLEKGLGYYSGMKFWQEAFSESESMHITPKDCTIELVTNPNYGFCNDPVICSDTRKADITKFALEYNSLIKDGKTEDDLLPYQKYDVVECWALADAGKYETLKICVSAGAGGVYTDGFFIMNDQPDRAQKVLVKRYLAEVDLAEINTWSYAGKIASDGSVIGDAVPSPTPLPKSKDEEVSGEVNTNNNVPTATPTPLPSNNDSKKEKVDSSSESSLFNVFTYNGEKLYSKSKITKGKKHFTKLSDGKNTCYQIVKITKKKIVLRPQKGFWLSDDPYFKKNKITVKLSSKCNFYYTNVSFPGMKYKRITKKNAKEYIKDDIFGAKYGKIEGESKKYYIDGYFGDIYTKKGKVVAIITNGGD